MRRMIVRVDEQAHVWTVAVQTRGAGGDYIAVVEPYTLRAVDIGNDRRVPATPESRLPAVPVIDPMNEAKLHRMLCEGDIDEICGLLERIRTRTAEPNDVARYGRWLFECLLAPAWSAILDHPDVNRERAVEIALRWPADSADLHRLIWEAMRDSIGPLGGHPMYAVGITRLVPAEAPAIEKITWVPRVLFATSVGLSDPTIRPGAMFMGILHGLDARGRCRARAVHGVTVDKLTRVCESFAPDVVHLVAHGVLDDGRGKLMLAGEDGMEEAADATALVSALSAGVHRPLAVVLSACNSASPGEVVGDQDDPTDASPLAAQLVAAGIPIVSAVAGEISESACRQYTRRLSDAVHEGDPVVVAAARGRRVALVTTEAANQDIDWALPALFLAEELDPELPLVDSTQTDKTIALANDLDLRKEPVFVGRADILAAADRMVEPRAETGVIAVLADGATTRLGGTRLLREIGWRLLRDGHLPLFLGPYQKSKEPATGRDLIGEICCRAVQLTTAMDLPVFPPDAVVFELTSDKKQALLSKIEDAGPRSAQARGAVLAAIDEFKKRTTDLNSDALRGYLSEDLGTLAERARDWGAPFGQHSRAVLLCDDVDAWGPPGIAGQTGLECLLAMLRPTGLGSPNRPAPVVLTGSKSANGGGTIAEWERNTRPGFKFFTLGELAHDEALLGYQWVLLHPWTSRNDEIFARVYTATRAKAADWEAALGTVPKSPTNVEERLFSTAHALCAAHVCEANDDEGVWDTYKQQDFRVR
jgi:hypothetical protein